MNEPYTPIDEPAHPLARYAREVAAHAPAADPDDPDTPLVGAVWETILIAILSRLIAEYVLPALISFIGRIFARRKARRIVAEVVAARAPQYPAAMGGLLRRRDATADAVMAWAKTLDAGKVRAIYRAAGVDTPAGLGA